MWPLAWRFAWNPRRFGQLRVTLVVSEIFQAVITFILAVIENYAEFQLIGKMKIAWRFEITAKSTVFEHILLCDEGCENSFPHQNREHKRQIDNTDGKTFCFLFVCSGESIWQLFHIRKNIFKKIAWNSLCGCIECKYVLLRSILKNFHYVVPFHNMQS